MAGAVVQYKSNDGGGSSVQVTFDSNITQGNRVAVCIALDNGADIVTNVTDGLSNSYANDAKAYTGGRYAGIYSAYVTTGGACTVTATFSSSVGARVTIVEMSGIATEAVIDATNGAAAASGTDDHTGQVSPSQADFMLACLSVGLSGTITEDTGWTLIFEDETFAWESTSVTYKSSSATENPGWTAPNGTHGAVVVAYREYGTTPAYPYIAGTPALTQLTSANPGTVTMPSGITAGELLLVFCSGDTSGTFSQSGGSDWTILDQGDNGTAVHGGIFAKIAQGSDTLSVQFEANDFAAVTIRVANHNITDVANIVKGTASTGTGVSPDPPNCNPGTSGKYLWLEFFASDDDDNTSTYWSTDFTGVGQAESAQSTTSCMASVGKRNYEGSSLDPSIMALASSEEWWSQTIAIPPYAESGETFYKDLSDTWSTSESYVRMAEITLADTWDRTETIVKLVDKYFESEWHHSESFTKRIFISLSDAWQHAENFLAVLIKKLSLSDAWEHVEVFSTKMQIGRAFAEAWSVSESYVRKIRKFFADGYNVSEVFNKLIKKPCLDAWSTAENFNVTKLFKQAMSDALSAAESFATRMQAIRAFAEAWNVVETFIKRIGKPLADVWNVIESAYKKVRKAASDSLSAADDLVRQFIAGGPPPEGGIWQWFRRRRPR